MTSTAHLFDARNLDRYRRAIAAGAARVAHQLTHQDRPASGIPPAALDREIATVDLDRPLADTDAALDELGQVYLRDAVYFHHPRYLAHLNCPVVIPALLAEVVLSALNSSLDTWDQSAGATLIERRLIDWTADRLGLGDAADGVFTSGGTQSNLHALLLARQEAGRLAEKPTGAGAEQPTTARPEVLARLRVLTSRCAHFSVSKAAGLLGLSEQAVVEVDCDRQRRMCPAALARALAACHRDGLLPMAVVATAGTTDFGSIDPLPEIAAVCQRAGVWLHVDAAYGCGLLVSARRRRMLDGVEHADSVTVDFHKSFFQPVSSSAVLVRDRGMLRHVTYHADYLNPAHCVQERIPNQVDKSLQTTRRFDALKLWLTLRIMGPAAVGELFDTVVDRAAEAWQLLRHDRRFEVVTRPQLSALVFRYTAPGRAVSAGQLDRANRYARSALAAAGTAMVAGTVVDGAQYLKFTILNPATSLADIAEVLDQLAAAAEAHLRGDDVRPA